MWSRRTVLVGAAGAVAATVARARHASAAPSPASFRFLVISDTHVGATGDSDRLARLIPSLRQERPDFVLHLGDLVHRSVSRSSDLARARQALSGLPFPLHLVPGNHDIEFSSTERLLDTWRGAFGNPQISLDHKGWRFLGFNALAFSETCRDPALADAALGHLENGLSGAPPGRTVLFYHVPEFRPPVHDVGIGWRQDVLTRWRGLTSRLQPAAILAGHWHIGVRVPMTPCPLIVSPAVSAIGNMVTGYLRGTVQGDRLQMEQVCLETEGKTPLPAIIKPFLLPVASR